MEHYTLHESKSEKRFIIAAHTITDATPVSGTLAESWIDAKQRLGFELSEEQKRLLAKHSIPLIERAA